MSQFELVTITLSFVLGLSMTHILGSAASAVRARKELVLHWLPFAWAGCIFLLHVQFWVAARDIDVNIDSWTWSWYLNALLLAVLLFASGALVLPTESQQRQGALLEDFQEHGRLSLIPLAIYCFSWVPTSMRLGPSPFVSGNLAIMALSALALMGFLSRRPLVRSGTVLLFAAIQIWAMIFVWAGAGLS